MKEERESLFWLVPAIRGRGMKEKEGSGRGGESVPWWRWSHTVTMDKVERKKKKEGVFRLAHSFDMGEEGNARALEEKHALLTLSIGA